MWATKWYMTEAQNLNVLFLDSFKLCASSCVFRVNLDDISYASKNVCTNLCQPWQLLKNDGHQSHGFKAQASIKAAVRASWCKETSRKSVAPQKVDSKWRPSGLNSQHARHVSQIEKSHLNASRCSTKLIEKSSAWAGNGHLRDCT